MLGQKPSTAPLEHRGVTMNHIDSEKKNGKEKRKMRKATKSVVGEKVQSRRGAKSVVGEKFQSRGGDKLNSIMAVFGVERVSRI